MVRRDRCSKCALVKESAETEREEGNRKTTCCWTVESAGQGGGGSGGNRGNGGGTCALAPQINVESLAGRDVDATTSQRPHNDAGLIRVVAAVLAGTGAPQPDARHRRSICKIASRCSLVGELHDAIGAAPSLPDADALGGGCIKPTRRRLVGFPAGQSPLRLNLFTVPCVNSIARRRPARSLALAGAFGVVARWCWPAPRVALCLCRRAPRRLLARHLSRKHQRGKERETYRTRF